MIRIRVESVEEGDADASGADVVTLTRRGYGTHGIAEALSGCARRHHAGVIVVGSSGRSAGRKTLLGKVAKAVAHQALRPVLIVPAGERAT